MFAYHELLASAGAVIGQTRARLIEELSPLCTASFGEIVGEGVSLELAYRFRVAPEVDALRVALETAYSKDVARGFTADGPHADDLELKIRRQSAAGAGGSGSDYTAAAKHHASQGQSRILVLALKIAELDVLTRRSGHVPILLLDDVTSELDRTRNRRLFDRLGRFGGQVFLTTTHPQFVLLEHDRTDFSVSAGCVVASKR